MFSKGSNFNIFVHKTWQLLHNSFRISKRFVKIQKLAKNLRKTLEKRHKKYQCIEANNFNIQIIHIYPFGFLRQNYGGIVHCTDTSLPIVSDLLCHEYDLYIWYMIIYDIILQCLRGQSTFNRGKPYMFYIERSLFFVNFLRLSCTTRCLGALRRLIVTTLYVLYSLHVGIPELGT